MTSPSRACLCGCPEESHRKGRCAVPGCGCLSYEVAPRPGRPKGSTKPAALARTSSVRVYLSGSEKAEIIRAAAEAGKSVSAYVADVALDAARRLHERRGGV